MRITVGQLKELIIEAKKRREIWVENPAHDEDDDSEEFLPNWPAWPLTAYHGTSPKNVKKFLAGTRARAGMGLDFAFDLELAAMYGSMKGPDFVVLEVDISKLDKDAIVLNYDVGDSGFTYHGFVPAGAMKVHVPRDAVAKNPRKKHS